MCGAEARPRSQRSASAVPALALALLLLQAGPAPGQDEYVIGGGDVLQVNVWKNAELSQNVTVRPDGQITLPLIRDVTASGLTAMQLGKVLAERLSAFVNAPNVTVTVTSATNYRVFTQGAIANGMYVLTEPLRARQLLARAGGPTPEADLSRAYLLRGDTRVPVDLSPSSGVQDSREHNPALEPGDVLVVPFREVTSGRILVIGEVSRPQAIPFQEGMTLLDAYLAAGGGTALADLRATKVARQEGDGGFREIPVDLEEVLRAGALRKNIPLHPGDTLTIPYRPPVERIIVVGEVRTPRTMPFREGLTVLDAFVEAGGGTEYADLGSVRIVRGGSAGKREEIAVDLGRVMKKADLSRNVALSPGDVVVVPR